jgi:hypothetical protein
LTCDYQGDDMQIGYNSFSYWNADQSTVGYDYAWNVFA